MRKLVAIAVMSGALIVSASAAFAQNSTTPDQTSVSQAALQACRDGYWIDQQCAPFPANTQEQ